jgi:hypothetical protein
MHIKEQTHFLLFKIGPADNKYEKVYSKKTLGFDEIYF